MTAAGPTRKAKAITPTIRSRLNPHEAFMVDGGKRDHDIYSCNLSISGPVAYLTQSDAAAWRNTLDAVAAERRAHGFVSGNGIICPPSKGRHFPAPMISGSSTTSTEQGHRI